MIVEFAGCPGTGKTTLANDVAGLLPTLPISAKLAPGSSIRQSADNVSVSLGYFLPVLGDADLRRASAIVWRCSNGRSSAVHRSSRIASAIRRLGRHRAMQRDQSSIHLVDEGVTGIFLLAFAGGPEPFREDISRLCERLPIPDAVIYLRASGSELVRRHYARDDSPREWRGLTRSALLHRVNAIQSLLDSAMSTSRFENVMTIQSPLTTEQANTAATRVAEFIEAMWREHA